MLFIGRVTVLPLWLKLGRMTVGVARLLVRKLIPNAADGNTMEDIVTAKMRYDELDKKSNDVRLRLNSTVVKVEHDGNIINATKVNVDYINAGKAYRVRAKNVVMACYNMMVPHLVPGLPPEQAEALKNNVKSPLIYTSVGMRNWKALKELKIASALKIIKESN